MRTARTEIRSSLNTKGVSMASLDTLDVKNTLRDSGRWVYEMDDLDDIVGYVDVSRTLGHHTSLSVAIYYRGTDGDQILCCEIDASGMVVFRWPRAYSHWAALSVQQAIADKRSTRAIAETACEALLHGFEMLGASMADGDADPFDCIYEFGQAVRMIHLALRSVADARDGDQSESAHAA